MIKQGDLVTLEYTLYSDEGTELDSSKGLGPLSFTIGGEQILPALEQALLGLNIGDTKEVCLTAADAYGPVYPSAFREIALSDLPEDCREEGIIIGIPDQDGQTRQVRIHQIKNDKAVLDFNHPLAGKNLRFEILIIDVNS
ncbi:MAG TPA: FKBP-type peptidyl-prolyl cis-trans isomerase [Coxiellaceae bacterium]|nr:FKBP-type peptidyl-prolyl cis-trans isomerase [Coxiellaceae bacterium]